MTEENAAVNDATNPGGDVAQAKGVEGPTAVDYS